MYEVWWVDLGQMPTQQLFHSSSLAGQTENKMENSWVNVETGRSVISYHHWKNKLDWEKIIYIIYLY